jgi:hypothetical protein
VFATRKRSAALRTSGAVQLENVVLKEPSAVEARDACFRERLAAVVSGINSAATGSASITANLLPVAIGVPSGMNLRMPKGAIAPAWYGSFSATRNRALPALPVSPGFVYGHARRISHNGKDLRWTTGDSMT